MVSRSSTNTILARLRWAKRFGKPQLLATRTKLAARLTATPPPIPKCPSRDSAEAEAARLPDDIDAEELLTAGGERETSTAERLLDLVERSERSAGNFQRAAQGLLKAIPEDDPKWPDAKELVAQYTNLAQHYLAGFNIDTWEEQLRQALGQLQAYLPMDAIGTRQIQSALIGPGTRPSSKSEPAGSIRGSAARGTAVGAVALIAGVLMAVASVTVLMAQYIPNHGFGTWTDYLTLVTTALGSAAAAGTITVLLLLRGPEELVG